MWLERITKALDAAGAVPRDVWPESCNPVHATAAAASRRAIDADGALTRFIVNSYTDLRDSWGPAFGP